MNQQKLKAETAGKYDLHYTCDATAYQSSIDTPFRRMESSILN